MNTFPGHLTPIDSANEGVDLRGSRRWAATMVFALAALLPCGAALAQTTSSIGFKIYHGEPMRPADRAGAVPASNWNNLRDLSAGTSLSMAAGTVVDSNGSVVSGLSAVFTGGTTVGGANTADLATGTANDARLFNAAYVQGTGTGVWFPGTGTPSTVKISNIPYANYDVYVYLADRGAGSAAKVDYGNIGYVASGGLAGTSGYVVSSAVLMNSPNIPKGNTIRIPNLRGPLSLQLQAVSNGASAPAMGFVGLQIVSTAAPAFTQPLTELYQYAVPLVPNQADYTTTVKPDPYSFAYLWLPPGVQRVRGLLVAQQNMLEHDMFADPTIRAALTQAGMGAVWMTPGGMNLGNTSSSGPRPVNGNPVQQEAIELVRALNALAIRSGYSEIANAPLMLTAHSAATPFVWTDNLHLAPALAGRVFALLPYKGWYPGDCPRDMPMFSVAASWSEGNTPGDIWVMSDNYVKGLLKQGTNCLLGEYLDVGSSHLEWNPGGAGPIGQFIVSAAAARIPATLPASGPVTLIAATYKSGYVIPYAQLGAANGAPVAAANYTGGAGTAYWFPDAATANAVQSRMAKEMAKQPQMIDVPLNGNSPLKADFGETVFWSGPSFNPDGTFKVAGQFRDQSPFPNVYPGITLGHSNNGGIQYRVDGHGGLRQVGPDTFKVWIDRGNIASQGYPTGGGITAVHPGDSSFQSTTRHVNSNIKTSYTTGNTQTITVAPIADQQASSPLAPVALSASATSGMPVQFWVVAGPYTITDDGVLQPQPIPTRTVYPMQVTVAAYQIGGRDAQGNAWQSAGPVYTTFNILKPGITNLAVGKPTLQSTTEFGGISARAVDGNTNGEYGGGSVTHTAGWDRNNWWQVDLQKLAQIDSIRIWNRTDCCADRLSNVLVFVSDTDMSGRTNDELAADTTVLRWSLPSLYGVGNATLPLGARGRYLRIQIPGATYLSLAEVQVYGTTDAAAINRAQGKPAKQSSTIAGGVAQRAVDANTNGDFAANSVTHTENSAWAPWWQVDLGASVAVDTVVLWNRTDCCSSRLGNLQVFVSATDMTGLSYAQLMADTTVKKVSVATLNGAPSLSIAMGGSAGRFVRVQLAGLEYLSLAEVQVFGR